MRSWVREKQMEVNQIVRDALARAEKEVDINITRKMEQGLIEADDERRERYAKGELPTL